MQIIDISANGLTTLDVATMAMLKDDYGIETHHIEASVLSALTSMRVASALKKTNAEVVVCRRRKDAVGAVDARRLADTGCTPVIVYAPQTEEELSDKLPPATVAGLAAIVVPTASDGARPHLKGEKTVVIEPGGERNTKNSNPGGEGNTKNGNECVTTNDVRIRSTPLRISWFGPIEEYTRLENAVAAVGQTGKGVFALHVYGTGPARSVMPIVKGARHMEHLDIIWHGDEEVTDQELSSTDLAIATTRIPNATDIRLRSMGIPVLDAGDAGILARTLKTVAADGSVPATLSETALTEYNTRFSLRFHVEQWRNLIFSIREK